jgi:hypothetical protein
MNAVLEYQQTMTEAIEEVRAFATRTTTGLTPELQRAVWLAVPFVRFGSINLELDRQIMLDYLAALEYGGYHGYDAEQIVSEADHLIGLWLMELDQ